MLEEDAGGVFWAPPEPEESTVATAELAPPVIEAPPAPPKPSEAEASERADTCAVVERPPEFS